MVKHANESGCKLCDDMLCPILDQDSYLTPLLNMHIHMIHPPPEDHVLVWQLAHTTTIIHPSYKLAWSVYKHDYGLQEVGVSCVYLMLADIHTVGWV